MTIHMHGTPLTPRSQLERMKGKSFCVSFANPADADWCLANGQMVLWDNGEYVFYRRRIKENIPHSTAAAMDKSKFYAWVEPRLGHPHWAVIPDIIGGSVEDNLALIKQWPFRKALSAPVWHLDEPISHLIDLVEMGFERICFGSAGAFWQVGSPAWCIQIEAAFNALIHHFGHLPWIHMLRGLAMCGDIFPFASADSVNVARNFKDTNADPERMARRIDAIQCPVTWKYLAPLPDQHEDMFA